MRYWNKVLKCWWPAEGVIKHKGGLWQIYKIEEDGMYRTYRIIDVSDYLEERE